MNWIHWVASCADATAACLFVLSQVCPRLNSPRFFRGVTLYGLLVQVPWWYWALFDDAALLPATSFWTVAYAVGLAKSLYRASRIYGMITLEQVGDDIIAHATLHPGLTEDDDVPVVHLAVAELMIQAGDPEGLARMLAGRLDAEDEDHAG